MEVPICLQYIILHTGIMYCMNLCHSKVVWKYYTGLMCFVGILAFGGWCPHGRCPTTVMIFGAWVCSIESVWQDLKCHRFEAVCPIVPPLKIMCCPVLWCSRCVFQMCSCSSRCLCILPAFLYVVYCDVNVWQMWLPLRFLWIMFTLCLGLVIS